MSRRMRKQFRRQDNGIFSLNITSMTDMFTLLLVFLLQTYATSDVRIEMEEGVNLPISSSLKDPVKAPQVSVSSKEIKVDGEVVASLDNGSLKLTDVEKDGLVKPLFEALRMKAPAEPTANDAVILMADSSQDMSALNPYLTTIAAAGFAKVKLATVLGR